jgi:hypothetical protein
MAIFVMFYQSSRVLVETTDSRMPQRARVHAAAVHYWYQLELTPHGTHSRGVPCLLLADWALLIPSQSSLERTGRTRETSSFLTTLGYPSTLPS